MPNIAAVLKEEIRRLAKKEIRAQVGTTKQAVVKYRSDIAKLKRVLSQQEREIKLLKKQQPQAEEEPEEAIRFSARSVKAQRSRLGLSAADYGKLVGVSGLTIYNWEHGTLCHGAGLAMLADRHVWACHGFPACRECDGSFGARPGAAGSCHGKPMARRISQSRKRSGTILRILKGIRVCRPRK